MLFHKFAFFDKNKPGLAARTTPAVPTASYRDRIATEAIQVIADASKHSPAGADVHVQMMFKPDGQMIVCKLKHTEALRPSEGSRAPFSPSSPSADCQLPTQELPIADAQFEAARRLHPQPTLPAVSPDDLIQCVVLGSGAQGKVVLVRHKTTGKTYALKTIAKKKLKPWAYPLIFREQAALKDMDGSPFFPQLLASWEDNDHLYLLTDYCSGGDLRQKLAKTGTFSLEETKRYGAQLVFAVDTLVKHRIIHRDIKLANIFLTKEDNIVLGDFGMTCPFGRGAERHPWELKEEWAREHGPHCLDDVDYGMDMTMSECGTIGSMAPEVMRGEAYTYVSDVFAVGVSIYQMTHNTLPYSIESCKYDVDAVHDHVMNQPLVIGDHIDPLLRDLLHQMLEKDPSRRATIEQVKSHPWFSNTNWEELVARSCQQSNVPSATSYLPSKGAKHIKFGTPYAPGEAPHFWYQHTSPALHSPPEDARKKSLRTMTAKWKKASSPPATPPPTSPCMPTVPATLRAAFATPILPRQSPSVPSSSSGHSDLSATSATLHPSPSPSPTPTAVSGLPAARRPPPSPAVPTPRAASYAATPPRSTISSASQASATAIASPGGTQVSVASADSVSTSYSSSTISEHRHPCAVAATPGRTDRAQHTSSSSTASPTARLPTLLQRAWRALSGVRTVQACRVEEKRLDLLDC